MKNRFLCLHSLVFCGWFKSDLSNYKKTKYICKYCLEEFIEFEKSSEE